LQARTSLTTSLRALSRRQVVASGCIDIIARWAILVILASIVSLLVNAPIWPPSLEMAPILLLLWIYGLFNLFATIALVGPKLKGLLNIGFIVDIVFISLLTYLSHDPRDLFYPLYLLPLVSASFRLRPFSSLLTGVFAAALYILAYLLARIGPNNGTPPYELLALIGLSMRVIALVYLPWLISILVERWTVGSRHPQSLLKGKQRDARSEGITYRDQMRSLHEVAAKLSATTNEQSILDTTLMEVHHLVPYTRALVLLSTNEPDELKISASYGLGETDQGKRVVADGKIRQVLHSSDAVC